MTRALVLCIILLGAVLPVAAIGYQSAFVETERQLAREAEEEAAEDNYKLEEGFGGGSAQPSVAAEPASFAAARDLRLAVPSLNPVSDVTSKIIFSLMDAIFLRFKQQLFISFVTQWKDELLSSEYQYLFPHLADLLSSTDSANFLSSFDLWKSAVDRDLDEAPWGVAYFSLKVLESDPQASDAELALLGEISSLVSDVYSFRNVSNLHEFILVSTTTDAPKSELFNLIGIIAKNMLDEEGQFVLDDIRGKIGDPHWQSVYLQMLQKDVREISLNGDTFSVTAENIGHYLDSCVTVTEFFDQLNAESSTAPQTPEPSRRQAAGNMQGHLKLYFSTCDKLILQWAQLRQSAEGNWDEFYSLYTRYRFRLSDIAAQADERQYKQLLNTVITASLNIAREHGYVPPSYSRFLNLISTVALTEPDASINYRDLMDAALEPVGSYAYKRQSDFSVGMNSYLGLAGGAEALSLSGDDVKPVAGLSCPLGLEVNWGENFSGVRGLFISALDLGALASYRFSESDTLDSSSPQIGWKQLVSPGLYFLLQGKNHPITLGLGAQLTPDLRQVKDSGIILNKNALRLGAFLSVDIPLFTFYVRHAWMDRFATRQPRAASSARK